jgi:hypothetical protein
MKHEMPGRGRALFTKHAKEAGQAGIAVRIGGSGSS